VRRSRLGTKLGTARFDRHNRLVSRNLPGNLNELARVTEILQVHQDDISTGVILEILQNVVGGNIRLVADRCYHREADPELLGHAHDALPHGSRLGDETQIAFFGVGLAEGSIKVHFRISIDDPEAVRPNHAHSILAHSLKNTLL